jgi:hypothetical protein
MQECQNCERLFKFDFTKNVIGQDVCPECDKKLWVTFLATIHPPKVGA